MDLVPISTERALCCQRSRQTWAPMSITVSKPELWNWSERGDGKKTIITNQDRMERFFPWFSRHHRFYQCSGSPLSETTHTAHSLSSPVRLGGDMIMPHQCVTLSQTRNWFQQSTQRRSVFNNHRLHSLSSVPFCSPWRHSPPGGIGAHQKSRQDCACVFDLSWIRFDES